MVKHNQTIRRQQQQLQPTNCLTVFYYSVGLALKGLIVALLILAFKTSLVVVYHIRLKVSAFHSSKLIKKLLEYIYFYKATITSGGFCYRNENE